MANLKLGPCIAANPWNRNYPEISSADKMKRPLLVYEALMNSYLSQFLKFSFYHGPNLWAYLLRTIYCDILTNCRLSSAIRI